MNLACFGCLYAFMVCSYTVLATYGQCIPVQEKMDYDYNSEYAFNSSFIVRCAWYVCGAGVCHLVSKCICKSNFFLYEH